VDGDPKSKTIVPIILINYIENAFKYGVNPDKPSKIVILIFIDSQGIRMTVENDIVVNDFMTGENTGEGSKNTAKRLDFHYPNKYHLDISQVNGSYKTTLYINLT
jgi:LytS/YehU family sensor histidine kinase